MTAGTRRIFIEVGNLLISLAIVGIIVTYVREMRGKNSNTSQLDGCQQFCAETKVLKFNQTPLEYHCVCEGVR